MDEDPNLSELRQDGSNADVTVDDIDSEDEPNDKPELTPEPQAEPDNQQDTNPGDYSKSINVYDDLPSRGVLYDFERVRFRGLTPDEEDQLESIQSLFESRETIRQLVQNCTNVDVMNFTYGDLLSMYIWIRIKTWNHKYPYSIDCIQCSHPINNVFNLENLPVEFLDDDYEEPYVIYFGQDEIHLRQIRVRDEQRVENFIEKRADQYDDLNQQQLNIKARRALMIDQAPDVQDTITDKMRFLRGLETKQYAVIKQFSNETTHGVGFEVNHECGSCGNEFEAPLPFKPEFLYPDPGDVIDMDDFKEPN
jgi:hypothetical protein